MQDKFGPRPEFPRISADMTASDFPAYSRRVEEYSSDINSWRRAVLERKRASYSSNYEFVEDLFQEKQQLDMEWRKKWSTSVSDKWHELTDLWNLLPEDERALFEVGSIDSPSGRLIPYQDLSLATICGNLREDYDPDYSRDFRSYSSAWKGPLHSLTRSEDIQRITQIAEAAAIDGQAPRVLEIGAGTGLLSLLLAQTGKLEVTGMDPGDSIYGEGDNLQYSHPNLQLRPGTSKAPLLLFKQNPPDVVLSSWMPQYVDFTDDIVALQPKVIIYVHPNDSYYEPMMNTRRGEQVAKRFIPKRGYRRAYSWGGPGFNDVVNWWAFVASERSEEERKGMIQTEELTQFHENLIEVHIREDAEKFPILIGSTSSKYPWEEDDLTRILPEEVYRKFSQKPEKFAKLCEGLGNLLCVDEILANSL